MPVTTSFEFVCVIKPTSSTRPDRTTAHRWRSTTSRSPACERDEPRPLVRVRRNRDARTILTTAAQHLVERFHADEQVVHDLRVERFVESAGAGEIPCVDENVPHEE